MAQSSIGIVPKDIVFCVKDLEMRDSNNLLRLQRTSTVQLGNSDCVCENSYCF